MKNTNNIRKIFLKRIITQLRPYWTQITSIFIFSILAIPLALLRPFSVSLIIDSAFGNRPLPAGIRWFFPMNYQFTFDSIILIAITLIIAAAAIQALFSFASWIISTYTGEKMVLDFRTRLFNHIQRMSLTYHDTIGTSDSLYKLQWDTVGIRTLWINNIIPLIVSLVTLIAMTAVMFAINWRFTLLASCIIPPMLFLVRISKSKLKRSWNNVKDEESRAMGVLYEVLGSLRVVKAFGQENGEEQRFVRQSAKAVEGQMKVARVAAFFNTGLTLLFTIGTALFLFIGAHYVHSGNMTLGELTMMVIYLAQFFNPLQNISKSIADIQSSIVSISRVYDLLDQKQEVTDSPSAIHMHRSKGHIQFQNVYFSYANEKDALQNISFDVQPGDRVGIMGSTGAGKSSIMSLLMRFYEPVSGEILIDGKYIKDIKLADYRNQFSIVLQEPVLFSTTIAENIKYGRPEATEQEIIVAAKAANAHDFIVKCKEGYNTIVGERGMQLSGGERQRISIARAFIKNAPVLILDEPTSSVDVNTEGQIMDAVERLMVGRTSFLITHRLDTLNACKIILHLENGRIIDIINAKNPQSLESKKAAFISNVNI